MRYLKIFLSIAALSVQSHLFAQSLGSVKPYLSQKSYEIWSSEKCEPLSDAEILDLTNKTHCHSAGKSFINGLRIDSQKMTENVFFNYAAKQQSQILLCQISKLSILEQANEDSQKFIDLTMNDIASKIDDLRQYNRTINEIEKKRSQLEVKLQHINAQSPETIDQMINDKRKYDAQLAELIPRYKSIYKTIWSSSDPVMIKYLDRLIDSEQSVLEYQKKHPFKKDVLENLRTQRQNDLRSLEKQYDRKLKLYDLNQQTKETLLQNGEYFKNVDALGLDAKSSKKLYCQINSRYLKGAEYLENELLVGSMLFGGVGLLGQVAAAGKMARMGVALNAKQAEIAVNSAEVLLGMSGALGGVNTINALDQCSNYAEGVPSASQTDNCTMTAQQMTSFESVRLEQANCVLGAVMAAAPLGFQFGFKESQKIRKKIKDNILLDKKNESLFAHYKEHSFSGPIQPVIDQRKKNVLEASDKLFSKDEAELIRKKVERDYADFYQVNDKGIRSEIPKNNCINGQFSFKKCSAIFGKICEKSKDPELSCQGLQNIQGELSSSVRKKLDFEFDKEVDFQMQSSINKKIEVAKKKALLSYIEKSQNKKNSLSEMEELGLSRANKETTLWPDQEMEQFVSQELTSKCQTGLCGQAKTNWKLDSEVDFNDPKLSGGKGATYVVDYKNKNEKYQVFVRTCLKEPCPNRNGIQLKPGDVTAVYPKCGPAGKVVVLPKLTDLLNERHGRLDSLLNKAIPRPCD